MKVFVLVCSIATLARASLEPAGYSPPGSAPRSNYLPPSASDPTPDNRYVPSSLGPASHHSSNIPNELLSNSLALPLKNSPAPFTQYLPANRQSSDRTAHAGDNFSQTPSSRYIPAAEIQHSFTRALPLNDYLPPKHNAPPSNAYLTPNKYSPTGFNGLTSDFAPTGQYAAPSSGHRHNGLDRAAGGGYPSGYPGHDSASAGYNYKAPENNLPAKYDFEYKVKDNYGNDYGHRESRNGENTQGVYTVVLPDGRRQIVHYEADSHGYRPTITYEDLVGSQSGYNNNQGYNY